MASTATPEATPGRRRRSAWLRHTLRKSQHEAVAGSAMTATSDHFFNAYAIFLNATLGQMGWLTGLPQLFGALAQLLSVWLVSHFARKPFIVACVVIQALVVFAMGVLAWWSPAGAVWYFILLAVLYHGFLNLIQPHWRAWMGSIVPERRRGAFFAARTRLTMAASLGVFFIGGSILTLTDARGLTWLGFALLFAIASGGRLVSGWLMGEMHDPEPRTPREGAVFRQSLTNYALVWRDRTFRQYSLFVAGMQGMVAISAPFFAVYMLRELEFSYLEFVLVSVTSIVCQFVMLRFWGRFSDRFGNRLVMGITSVLIPVVPLMWFFSGNFYYILLVQAVSGFAWSGFTLSTSNYLYDIRPFRSDFATYAALQAALGAVLIFFGALGGGAIASLAPQLLAWSGWDSWVPSSLFVVFGVSALLRGLMTLWFVPRSVEPRVRPRPKFLNLIFRVARFNAISGVVLDWLTVDKTRKEPGDGR